MVDLGGDAGIEIARAIERLTGEVVKLREAFERHQDPPRERVSISANEAARVLACSRTRVFELLTAGILERAPSFGRETMIKEESIERAQGHLAGRLPVIENFKPVKARKRVNASWKPIEEKDVA